MSRIDIRKVVFEEDRLPVDLKVVAKLVDSIPRIGLLNPIIVTSVGDTIHLVAGRNRLEAYRELHASKANGYATIPIKIIEHPKGSKLDFHQLTELAEIDENLLRRDLTREQRDSIIAKKKSILVKMNPEQSKGGGDRQSKQARSPAAAAAGDTTKTIANELGISSSVVREASQFDKVFGDHLVKLSGTSLGTRYAKRAFIKSSLEEQEKLLTKALEEHEQLKNNNEPKPTPKPKKKQESKKSRYRENENAVEFTIKDAQKLASIALSRIRDKSFQVDRNGLKRLETLADATAVKWQEVSSKLAAIFAKGV